MQDAEQRVIDDFDAGARHDAADPRRGIGLERLRPVDVVVQVEPADAVYERQQHDDEVSLNESTRAHSSSLTYPFAVRATLTKYNSIQRVPVSRQHSITRFADRR